MVRRCVARQSAEPITGPTRYPAPGNEWHVSRGEGGSINAGTCPCSPGLHPQKREVGQYPEGMSITRYAIPSGELVPTIIGLVASNSMEPKYAAPPANPASTHGTVTACKRIYESRSLRCSIQNKTNKHTISHFRFPRRIARYSDQGSEFLAAEGARVDLKRIDDMIFPRAQPTTACLGETQSRADGKGRREVAMAVQFLAGRAQWPDTRFATCRMLTCHCAAHSQLPSASDSESYDSEKFVLYLLPILHVWIST
jgi:hypothetical protein